MMKLGIIIFAMIPNIIEPKTLHHMTVKLYYAKIMVIAQDSLDHIIKMVQKAQFHLILKRSLFIQV